MNRLKIVRDLEKQGLELKAAKRGSESSHNTAKYMFEFIYAYELHLPALNIAKGKLDAAYIAKDVSEFEIALREFKHEVFQIREEKKKFKARRNQKHLKIHENLYYETWKKIDFIEDTIRNGEKWVKESSMSPAKLEASRRASLRMKMRWGSF